MIGVVVIPRPPQLLTASGDPVLIEVVRDQLPSGAREKVSVIYFDGRSTTSAHFGATDDTEYEIGSVTMTMTAALYADALERGVVNETMTLGELLELGDSPAAGITLESLATQSSGLPRLPITADILTGALLTNFTAGNPYQFDLAELEAQSRGSELGQQEFLYSNLGFALLGQAVAAAADKSYSQLVDDRIFAPLDMTNSFYPAVPGDLRPGSPTGFTSSGRKVDAWPMDAYGPAGAVRSTAADMMSYVRAMLDGSGTGASALEPRADAGGLGQIGYAWLTTEGITWHNGMTGGFASFVGMDRKAGTGVVILTNTAVGVDELGFTLLGGVVDAPIPIRRPKPANRAGLAVAFAESVLILVLAHRLVDWVLINPLLWLLPVALLSFGVALTVHSWHELPRWKEGRPVGRSMLWLGIQLALILAVLILVLVLLPRRRSLGAGRIDSCYPRNC